MKPTSAEALAEADADLRSRKGRGSRFIHDELVVAEAPRKQNQLTTHPRKLKLRSRKQRGRARGRQVGLEENYIGVFATAHLGFKKSRYRDQEKTYRDQKTKSKERKK